jgi:uncharacterized protein
MSLATVAASFTRPGTKLVENQAGSRVPDIASHNTVYMLGTSSLGAYESPTQVVSLADFSNQFGASSSEDYIKTMFREYAALNLYFTRVNIADIAEIQITGTTAGTIAITINSIPVSVTVPTTGATVASIANDLLVAINTTTNVASIVTAYSTTDPSKIKVVADIPGQILTIVESSSIVTVTDFAPTVPSTIDYVQALSRAFDADDQWAQGFLVCPEAFQNLASSSDRLAVGNAMELLCRSEGFDWVPFIDSHPSVNSDTLLRTDAAQYVSAIGHLAYFHPYLITLEDVQIPPSGVVAASACRKYSVEGFQEPIGGTRYKLSSVKDVVTRYVNSQQDQLNPLGINLIRNLRNKGVCIWGMRTRASDSDYRFIHTRVIMNVVNGSLRSAFDDYPFSSIDGIGIVLHRIEETANSVGIRLWQSNALFGGTPQEAFQAICNFNNNTAENLETGIGILQFYAAPVPGLERLLIGTYRVQIGQVQDAANGLI